MVAPVWALAVVGLVVLWRGGRRAEAAVAAGVASCFLLYDAAYYQPFGGFPSGPRLLVPMLPFLALPVAAAWRLVPGVAAALAIASIVVTSVATLADPIVFGEDPGSWFHRLERDEVARTIFRRALGDGFAEIVPVVLLFAAAVVIALLLLPSPRIDVRGLLHAAAALVAWRAVYVGAPILLTEDRAAAGFTGLLAVVGVVAAIALGLVLLVRGAVGAAVVAAPAALVAWPAFAAHRGLALATIGMVLLALLVVAWRRRSGGIAVRTS